MSADGSGLTRLIRSDFAHPGSGDLDRLAAVVTGWTANLVRPRARLRLV